MAQFEGVTLRAIRGGDFEAELLHDTGYTEWSVSRRRDDAATLPGIIVVWVNAERSPDFANALKEDPQLPLTLVSNYGDLPCTVLSISGWPPIRIELQPARKIRARVAAA